MDELSLTDLTSDLTIPHQHKYTVCNNKIQSHPTCECRRVSLRFVYSIDFLFLRESKGKHGHCGRRPRYRRLQCCSQTGILILHFLILQVGETPCCINIFSDFSVKCGPLLFFIAPRGTMSLGGIGERYRNKL
jgi:hypothetical protein